MSGIRPCLPSLSSGGALIRTDMMDFAGLPGDRITAPAIPKSFLLGTTLHIIRLPNGRPKRASKQGSAVQSTPSIGRWQKLQLACR